MATLGPEAPSPLDNSRGRRRNALGIASAALGVTSVATVLFVGPLIGVIAVATGFRALRRVKRGEATKRSMAVIGIILGLVSILIGAGILYFAIQQSITGCWPVKEHTGCY